MRRLVPLVLVSAIGSARAEDRLPPLVVISSVTATSSTTAEPWSVVLRQGGGDGWCVDTSKGGVGEALTLVFDPPAMVDGIVVRPASYASRLTALDVEIDGKTRRVTKRDTTIDVPMKDAPVKKLVLKVAAFEKAAAPAACIEVIQFQGAREPGVVYGVSAAEAATLEPRIQAIRTALKGCTGLADVLAFPFSYSWQTMSRSGLDMKRRTYATAAKATAACKRGQLAPVLKALRLDASTIVAAAAPRKVTIIDEDSWHLELRDGTWVLTAVGDL